MDEFFQLLGVSVFLFAIIAVIGHVTGFCKWRFEVKINK